MTDNPSYQGDDLAAAVWPRQSEPAVRAGTMTWEEAAREAWAMDPNKADRVRALVAIHDDVVVGAWGVTSATHVAAVPPGKTRMVSRSEFTTVDEPRLAYLVGTASPLPRRRNPQTTIELRDLPGAESLWSQADPHPYGLVRLGEFTLTVSASGRAELHMPAGLSVTVRTG